MAIHYHIRHLATPWNEKGFLQGSRNISISDSIDVETIENRKINKAKLIGIKKEVPVLVSSLVRTHQTANFYGFKKFEIEPLIDELNFGKYEGRSKQLMIEDIGDIWLRDPRDLVLGESLLNFEKRLMAFLKKYNSVTCIIFSHGAVIRGLKSILSCGNISKMNEFHIENNSLNPLKIDLFPK